MIFIKHKANGTSRPVEFHNALDYDVNFFKVMVSTGLTNKHTPLGHKKQTYRSNLPEPRIAYNTTRPDGALQVSISAQTPQSGYFALQYAVLGLGRFHFYLNFIADFIHFLSFCSYNWCMLVHLSSQMLHKTDRKIHRGKANKKK